MIPLFYRQLAAMLNAGVPISQALASLAASTPRGSFKGCLRHLAESTGQGTRLSVAMADFPTFFPVYQRAVIAAGETSGTLVLCTSRLSEHLEREQTLCNEVKGELLSSRLTMLVTLIFWPVVWGRLRASPLLLVIFGIVPLVCFGGLLLLGSLMSRLSGHFPLWLDRTIARMPIFGRMAWAIAQAKFVRSLASLYQSGLSLPESVQLACDSNGNLAFSERVRPAIPKMQRGLAISEALAATHA
jgi:type IV pilus assembly protein PilC